MNKQAKKKIRLFGLAIIILGLATIFVLLLSFFSSYYQASDFDEKSKELCGNFKLYEGKVYVSVPSDGYLPVDGAAPNSLVLVNSELYAARHIAMDKNNVYCGNKIVPNMNPKTIKALGNSYYTDGKNTYYCGIMTVDDDEPAPLVYVWQLFKYNLFSGNKPQRWHYPIKRLADSPTPYRSLLKSRIATNGTLTYYNGELMQGADPSLLQHIKEKTYPSNNDIDSYVYSSDGKTIYYKAEALPLKPTNSLYSMDCLFDDYLFEPETGMVYANNIPFDRQFAPYTLLNAEEEHSSHQILLSKDGIFFYDTIAKKVVRAGDNLFHNKGYKALTPYIYSNGEEMLFLNAYEVRAKGQRAGNYLISRNTSICRLEGLPSAGEWVNLGNLYRYGSVWQYGKDYYYFDNNGDRQGFESTIYKIRDRETAESLLANGLKGGTRFVEELIEQKLLTLPKYKVLLDLETNYESLTNPAKNTYPYYLIFLLCLILITRIPKLIKKAKEEGFTFEF